MTSRTHISRESNNRAAHSGDTWHLDVLCSVLCSVSRWPSPISGKNLMLQCLTASVNQTQAASKEQGISLFQEGVLWCPLWTGRGAQRACAVSTVAEHEPFRVGPVILSFVWTLSIAGILAWTEDLTLAQKQNYSWQGMNSLTDRKVTLQGMMGIFFSFSPTRQWRDLVFCFWLGFSWEEQMDSKLLKAVPMVFPQPCLAFGHWWSTSTRYML